MQNDYPVTVTVVDVSDEHGPDWPPSNLVEFIAWVTNHMASIPSEFRAVARIEIGSTTSYDDAVANLTISYDRPATADEIARRNANAIRRAEEDVVRLRRAIEHEERRLAEMTKGCLP